jgi:4-amino-4-deoxy-L-arabinose transferase-like glycosyltransferase
MWLSNIISNKYSVKILFVAALVISVFLSYSVLRSQLVFGFDQARDAFEAHAIWHNHDLKILGPSSDIPGVHHGVLWYYFLAIIYFIAGGDPALASIVYFIIIFATVPLGAWVVHKIFKDWTITFVFALLYASSPIFQIFNRWLSNPSLALIISPLLLFYIYSYIKSRARKHLFIIGIGLGLLIQADFAFGIFIFTLLFYSIYYKLKFSLKDIFFFLAGLGISVSTFIAAEIKFNGKSMSGITSFLSSGFSSKEAIDSLIAICNKLTSAFALTVFPFPKLLVFLFLCLFFWKYPYKNDKKSPIIFLLIWLSNIIIFQLFSSGFVNSNFMLAPSIFVLVAIGSYILVIYARRYVSLTILVAIIFLLQTVSSQSFAKANNNPLSVQQGMFLKDEERVIEYTYLSSQNKPFIITTITNPLFINTTWAYLYEFYGQKKYGYVPYLNGRSQAGFLGGLPQKNFGINDRYLIMEPPEGIVVEYIAKIIYEEDKVSDIIEEKKFGKFTVQKRLFHKNKGAIFIPQILLNYKHILEE